MAFEPKKITREHVLKAIEHVKDNQIELIPSRKYKVLINGEYFPPKDILRYAHQQMNGEHIWTITGGEPTNKFLKDMGFEILNIQEKEDPVADMINRYKERIKNTKWDDEIYKWQLTKRFNHRPDTSATDFYEEITTIDYSNLIYPVCKTVINHIAKERPEEFRNAFIQLFDESIELEKRVNEFSTETLRIYCDIDPENKYSHHQDERTISTYLAFYNSEKYSLFKDSFYQKYCKMIGVKSSPKGQKYVHYIKLLSELIEDYIIPDQELLELKSQFIPQDASEDQSHYILAQDILFQMLDKRIDSHRKYWRVGTTDGNKKYWDLMYQQHHTSIGWPFLGDLNEVVIENKQDLIILLQEKGYYMDNKIMASRKAGEVLNFYSDINVGDVILAQDGQSVNGIGIVADDYKFEDGLDFPHTKSMDWKIINPKDFKNGTGLRTTVYELTDPVLINKIDGLLKQENIRSMESDFSLNTILYGPPGTGKTYQTIDLSVQIAATDQYIYGNHKANKIIYDKLVEEGQIMFATFHQSMCYEDFIEGIKPQKPEENDNFLKYEIEPGIFLKICSAASTPNQTNFNTAYNKLKEELTEKEIIDLNTPRGKTFSISLNRNGNLNLHTGESKNVQGTLTRENIQKQLKGENVFYTWTGYFQGIINELKDKHGYNPEKGGELQNFVLIIDEINRGNVAQIFGELITLIEEDKRQGKDEAIKVTLPYSKDEFTVPSNLYIIGTMNTADRSIEALDTALRRRFSFKEIMPIYDLEGMEKKIAGVKIGLLLETINDRIEKLVDRDHQIGHSYFLNIFDEKKLMKVFEDKVIPLLQEYFYGNYERIGLVLGNGFIEKIPDDKVIFAQFPSDEYDLNDKVIYRLRKEPLESVDLFKSAIKTLMNNL